MDEAEHDVLASTFPKHRRSNGSMPRSSAAPTSLFPNDRHLVGAILLEQNDEWARRYMTLESIG